MIINCYVFLLIHNQERRKHEFEATHNRKVQEAEQEKKKARLEEEERQLRQRKQEKEQQEHQLEMQNSALQAEMSKQRNAWLFEKERNSYNDRRKHTLDEKSAIAADERGAELFRREGYLAQSQYDRRIYYSARSHITEKRYRSEYGVKQYDGGDKEESDSADAAGTTHNPHDGGGDDHDDDDADGEGDVERPSFSPYLD
jgi:hypothetical protein